MNSVCLPPSFVNSVVKAGIGFHPTLAPDPPFCLWEPPPTTCTHTHADLRWTVNWAAAAPQESVPREAVTSGTAFPTLA